MAEPRSHSAGWTIVGSQYVVLGLLLLLATLDVVTVRWSVLAPVLVMISGAGLLGGGLLNKPSGRQDPFDTVSGTGLNR